MKSSPVSVHEKARIMMRLSQNATGLDVKYAYHIKRPIGMYDDLHYLMAGDAQLYVGEHVLYNWKPGDERLILAIPRYARNESRRIVVGYNGEMIPDVNPQGRHDGFPIIMRWWLPEDPIPEGLEIHDQYFNRIYTLK